MIFVRQLTIHLLEHLQILGENTYYSSQGPIVPCNLYLLDNFNNRIVTINFDSAWLSTIKPVALDYSKNDNTELTTTAELKFYKYNIQVHDEYLKKFIQNSDH